MLYIASLLTGLIGYIVSSIFNCGILFFVTFFAAIILNIEVLSLFKGITGQNILIITALEFIIALIFWLKKGKPLLKVEFKKFIKRLKVACLKDKTFIFLSVSWLFLILISFILASFSPVNEPDAQGYHALRALFWAQNHFISHFEISDIRCHVMPINSELFYTWVYALSKNDTVLGLLQFFAYFLTIFSGYKIMGFYNISFNKRLWSIFIFTSFAGVISQMSSTQTDLTVGSLFVASIYFILNYSKNKNFHMLFFSSLALSLAFGVKSTGIIGGVPILIWFIFILRKDFFKFFFFLTFNFLVFSSYNYILNFIDYGNFLGSNTAILGHKFWGGYKGFIANFIRYVFQLFDFSGFTAGFYLNPYLLKLQNGIVALIVKDPHIGENVALSFTNIGMTEQYIGFGVLGFTIFLPSLISGFKNKKLKIFSYIFLAQILFLSVSIAYMIYSIRFIVAFMCISIPLLSLSYFKKTNIIKVFIVLFCLFYMGYASMFLSQRPFILIKKEFIKTPNIKLVQDKMRNLNYEFYHSFNEAYTLKSNLEPYCINGNNIALAISAGYMIYDTKFMEFSKDCKINVLNIPHMQNYNLSDYDVIVTQVSNPQKTNVLNKEDIKNPMKPSYEAMCYYRKLANNYDLVNTNYNEMDKAYEAQCKINDNYIKDLGYFRSKDFSANIPEYLKERIDETIAIMRIWTKK